MQKNVKRRIYFEEVQRFTQIWLWVILIISLGAAVLPLTASLYVQLVEGKPFGNNPSSDTTLLLTFFIVLAISGAVIVLFWKLKLVTQVGRDALIVRFPPFFNKPKVYTPDDIASFEIRTYRPIREYGGWGIRLGLRGHGRAYNVKGKVGLQLVFKSGKRLLIGTQRADSLARAMQRMMEGKEDA